MAYSLPNSEFVGVELSKRQNEEARQQAEAIGLKNIDLRNVSIMDIDESFGEFDYIIAHGVISWVPLEVQHKMLEVCGKRLKPNGVAYLSYNTYPGWHMRGMIRDMMNIHAGPFKDPVQRIQQARALLDFLAKQCRQENTPFGMFLKQELELLSKQADGYLFHEHLEENNHPIYFHEFVKMFMPKGLRLWARPTSALCCRRSSRPRPSRRFDRSRPSRFSSSSTWTSSVIACSGNRCWSSRMSGRTTRFSRT